MKLSAQRALDRIIGAPLCRILSLFPWRYRRVSPGFAPRRILVIILSEMGSLVLAKPMFDLIREKYRGAETYLLVFERNKGLLDVLDLVPKENILTLNDRSLRTFLRETLHILVALHRIGIDTVLDCELFSRISSLLSLLSGAMVRAGFHAHTQEGLYRGTFMNRPALYNPYVHISMQFTSMAQSLGSHGMPLVKETLHGKLPSLDPVRLCPEEKAPFFKRLGAGFPQLGNRSLVLLSPGGGLLPIRCWPLTSYCAVAKDLIEKGYVVGVIGTDGDRPLGKAISLSCQDDRCLDFTGCTKSVHELVLLLQRASLLIANDGGPGHFASLASIPSIVFYGPETPSLYGVLGERAFCFYSPLSCSPCLTAYNHRKSPCDGNNACLKRIPPEAVLEKAYEMMGRSGRKSSATTAPLDGRD